MLTKSIAQNIISPDGNSLAIYIDANTGFLFLKDVNGKVEPLMNYISFPTTSLGFKSITDLVGTQNLTANVDNEITFTGQIRTNGVSNYLSDNSVLTPQNLNDCLLLDFACSYIAPASAGNRFVNIKIIINSNVYRAQTIPIVKPGGQTDYFSISFNLPVYEAFLANGGKIYINPTEDLTIGNRFTNVNLIYRGQNE